MRRKSERNKAKGSPEKKAEKPTRRTTRRRGKEVTPEASPDRENPEENSSNPLLSEEDQDSRLQSQQESNEAETAEKPITSSELIKAVLGADEEDNGSVWKVARADASPGEIQKLKLCRQRNTSEASDSSSSKKKSNKWPDSGEGGMEEADSADEQVASSKNVLIDEQSDDTSSLHPGQDSHEEVSDHKENLPETISANLSDDKTNIDQLAENTENLPKTTTNLSEQSNSEDGKTENSSSVNLPGHDSNSSQSSTSADNVAEIASDNSSSNQQIQDAQENSNEPASVNSTTAESHQNINVVSDTNNECTNDQVIPTVNVQSQEEENTNHSNESCVSEVVGKETSEQERVLEETSKDNKTKPETYQESENEENKGKEKSRKSTRESNSVTNEKEELSAKDGDMAESQESDTQSSQQNHRVQYESSASDKSESEDEQRTRKVDSSNEIENIQSNSEEMVNHQSASKEVKSDSDIVEPEIELSESNIEKDDILEINEKSDDLNSSMSTSKPAKVSLKRSFSVRVSTDSEVKKDDAKNTSVVNESNQNKENHADNEQPDQKSCTKRRRWGMTTTSDVAPAFSISTDSLKAIVPGAKPLSVNEVKLNKDEDEEKVHRKIKNEVPDHKTKSDVVSKNDITVKKESKDNHIAPRRKITVVKEAPRPTSPSLPEAQATNVLLIKNLVRPFTLHQLKELLSRTGTIVENGFWIDRIKSKCFVEYANEDQAFETRQALHGVSWPLSNPKKLIVEYATKDDMEEARELSVDQPIARKTEPLISADMWQQDQWTREERTPIVNKITVIREWDLGKEDGQLHVKEKERERREFEKKKRQRSRSPVLEVHLPAPARKFKKKEEEPPTAKLLDDLFRKTKATPCIYWLPLTNEQIIVKEEMRRQHMAEHARRLEEMRRAERSRDTRRRRSPRK